MGWRSGQPQAKRLLAGARRGRVVGDRERVRPLDFTYQWRLCSSVGTGCTDIAGHWLGIVSAAHVGRADALGIAQIGHGKRGSLARMNAGDWLIYSPREQLGTGSPLQACTAIGQVLDEEVWQAAEGDFTPWCRRVSYVSAAVDARIHPTHRSSPSRPATTPSSPFSARRGAHADDDASVAPASG